MKGREPNSIDVLEKVLNVLEEMKNTEQCETKEFVEAYSRFKYWFLPMYKTLCYTTSVLIPQDIKPPDTGETPAAPPEPYAVEMPETEAGAESGAEEISEEEEEEEEEEIPDAELPVISEIPESVPAMENEVEVLKTELSFHSDITDSLYAESKELKERVSYLTGIIKRLQKQIKESKEST